MDTMDITNKVITTGAPSGIGAGSGHGPAMARPQKRRSHL